MVTAAMERIRQFPVHLSFTQAAELGQRLHLAQEEPVAAVMVAARAMGRLVARLGAAVAVALA